MFKKYNEFFKSLMLANDLVFVSVAWWLAVALRFITNIFGEPAEYLFRHYLIAWLLILCVWTVVSRSLDCYRPRRISSHGRELIELFKASSLALVIFLTLVFLLHEVALSRIVVVVFWLTSLLFLSVSHVAFREALRLLRRRGYNLRHVIVIGVPRQTQQLVKKLTWYRYLGIQVVAVYFTEEYDTGGWPDVPNVLSGRTALRNLVGSGTIDQIFVALPLEQAAKLPEIQQWLEDEPVTIHFVPDLGELAKLRGNMEEFDGV